MRLATESIVKPLPSHLFTLHDGNAETRWEAMAGQGYHTPNDRFFVRNHTATPASTRPPGGCSCTAQGCAAPSRWTTGSCARCPPAAWT
ncbi:hypothetical protein [Nonomuraea recticatena]|uniref:hypothetical protein n=1 Tax=Nonomuraea recticatena TaxID=46178 RepID=UPI0036176ED1